MEVEISTEAAMVEADMVVLIHLDVAIHQVVIPIAARAPRAPRVLEVMEAGQLIVDHCYPIVDYCQAAMVEILIL